MPVADHHVELAIGPEQDMAAVVIRVGARGAGQQHLEPVARPARDRKPHELVLQVTAAIARHVDVDHLLGGPARGERDPEGAALAGAVHPADREHPVVVARLGVEGMDLPGAAFEVPDHAVRREGEP